MEWIGWGIVLIMGLGLIITSLSLTSKDALEIREFDRSRAIWLIKVCYTPGLIKRLLGYESFTEVYLGSGTEWTERSVGGPKVDEYTSEWLYRTWIKHRRRSRY